MSDEKKQIDEMAKDICHSPNCQANGSTCNKRCKAYIYACRAINAGYRKQKVGEWLPSGDGINPIRCSICQSPALFAAGEGIFGDIEITRYPSPFCPNCGARMKGEKK